MLGIRNNHGFLVILLFFTVFHLPVLSTSEYKEDEPPECPPEGEEYFPDPESCEHYYVCVHGTAIKQRCPTGLWWDQINKICDRPWNVFCEIVNGTTSITNVPPTSTTTTTLRPTTTEAQLPSTSESSYPYCDPEREVYAIPFHGNCYKYYLCIAGVPYERECAPDLIFNPTIGACVIEDSYDCPWNPTSGTSASPTTSTTTTTTTTTTTSTTTTTTTPPTTTTTRRTTTTTDPTNPFPCPNDPFIYLPHPADCNLFYLCMNGEFRGVFSCGEDLWFHSELQGCVHPEDSDCSVGI